VLPSSRRAAIQPRPIVGLSVRDRLGFCDGEGEPASRRPMSLKFWTVLRTLPKAAPPPQALRPLRVRSLADQPLVLAKHLPQNMRAAKEPARVRWV